MEENKNRFKDEIKNKTEAIMQNSLPSGNIIQDKK
jgi:hypothetical protein